MLNGRDIDQRPGRHRARGGFTRRQNLGLGFPLDVGNFGLDLRFEFVRGALELVQSLANLPADLRHLLWPENNQGQQEKKHHFWKAKIHTQT